MQYTTFGATGLTAPRLCLGTATFGHQANETVAHQIMDTAVEAGVTFFDSADIYPMGGEGGRAGAAREAPPHLCRRPHA